METKNTNKNKYKATTQQLTDLKNKKQKKQQHKTTIKKTLRNSQGDKTVGRDKEKKKSW